MSTVKVDNIQTSAAGLMPIIKDSGGFEVGQLCTAWVRFDGTTGLITASFNVASVTKNGTGSYDVVFLHPMAVNTYAVALGFTTPFWGAIIHSYIESVSSFRIQIATAGLSYYDSTSIRAAIFGGK